MKPKLLLIAFVVTAALGLRAEQNPLTVAIFDFETQEEAIKNLGPKIANLLNAQLSTDPKLILVERAELAKTMGEQEMGISGTVSTETAAKIGHLTGAKILITGKAFKVDNDLMIVAKVIGSETSRLYGEIVKAPATGAIDELTAKLAEKISATISGKADTLVAKVLTREDRVEALKKILKDSKRPAVSVKIPEQHFGARVADPAAQTELSLILQQSGFTLVDEKSTQKADVEITGEAFSAFGLRRGNLISCKARIELKAQNKIDGVILFVDRETSVSVDIAEQIAAKTALQNGAAELASRLIPKIAGASKLAAR